MIKFFKPVQCLSTSRLYVPPSRWKLAGWFFLQGIRVLIAGVSFYTAETNTSV